MAIRLGRLDACICIDGGDSEESRSAGRSPRRRAHPSQRRTPRGTCRCSARSRNGSSQAPWPRPRHGSCRASASRGRPGPSTGAAETGVTSAGGGTLAAGASAVVDAAVGVGITSGGTDGVTATSGVTDGVGATVVSLAGLLSDRARSDCPTGMPAAMTTTPSDGGEHPRALTLLVAAALHELVEQVGGGRADEVGVAVQGGAQVEVVHRAALRSQGRRGGLVEQFAQAGEPAGCLALHRADRAARGRRRSRPRRGPRSSAAPPPRASAGAAAPGPGAPALPRSRVGSAVGESGNWSSSTSCTRRRRRQLVCVVTSTRRTYGYAAS